MTTATVFDTYSERVARGERLSADEIRELATTPDVLSLGMLADTLRRMMHDRRTTFLRVAESAFERPFDAGAAASAKEVRLTGEPQSLMAAVEPVRAARAMAEDRTVAAFTWQDVRRWSVDTPVARVLEQLKAAGLDALGELSIDTIDDPLAAIGQLVEAGFEQLRLTVHKASADVRTDLLVRVREWQEASGGRIQSINPLPLSLGTFRPTTGYEDVKMVAIARLAAPNVPTVQVDWRRYGPKLAQVALTFGANDLDGISASDAAPEGRRRAPLAEIRRNIEAAGLVPAERDGRFRMLA